MSLVRRLPPLLTNSPLSRNNRRGIHCSLWYASDLWPVVGHCISFSSLFYTAIFWDLDISKGYAFPQDLDFLVSCQEQNDLFNLFLFCCSLRHCYRWDFKREILWVKNLENFSASLKHQLLWFKYEITPNRVMCWMFGPKVVALFQGLGSTWKEGG